MEAAEAVDRLTYEIFSILEGKFLFGAGVGAPKSFHSGGVGGSRMTLGRGGENVCVLSIDGGARAADGVLAAAALVRLEAALQRRASSKAARLADYFDVAAGSGAGGVLAAMLFARGPCGRPMYSAEDALGFLLRRVRRGWSSRTGGLRRRPGAAFHKVRARARLLHELGIWLSARHPKIAPWQVFGELTLRDTLRPVLVPCYDLATRAPFLFSRAAAAESPAYDFRLRDACAATCAASPGAAVEVFSVDGATRIAAVGSGVALGNPTAAAITHVLNNQREFPAAAGINDLLVISIGAGEAGRKVSSLRSGRARAPEITRIAADGLCDMVDQAVAMAFGHNRTSNYVRIQGTGARRSHERTTVACGGEMTEESGVGGRRDAAAEERGGGDVPGEEAGQRDQRREAGAVRA
ncbi:hypothetical protein GUJ93_ZPchr0016g2515 [Zizania palustris]|uniref:PNPLA domain-containing protein n=1 Tax=Zizania palustris TaxID=103762 RepID=A0A8J5TM45_ZIZPA|nr:hypothetical protein GUJ93_ZPchr0016g2515 [Zizania palustris]